MTFLIALFIAMAIVATASIMADHSVALDWRKPSTHRGYPQTDVNQQWTVVDR